MKFLDASVFLSASLAQGAAARPAQDLLRFLAPNRPALTSVLVLDEVLWILRKRHGAAAAVRESRPLLAMPGLRILPVGPQDWAAALNLIESKSALKPRDALHAAVALSAGATTMVSTDADFDGIPGLRREALA